MTRDRYNREMNIELPFAGRGKRRLKYV